MKKKASDLAIAVFLFILIIPFVSWGFLSLFPAAYDAVNFDAGENRELTEISDDVKLEDLTNELDSYISDHAPYRSKLIVYNKKINAIIERNYTSKIQPVLLEIVFGKNESQNTLELFEEVESSETAVAKNETSKKPSVDVKKHNFVEKETVEATCMGNGYILYVCSDCGEEYTETLPALEHKEIVLEHINPSYTTYGRTLYQCVYCAQRRFGDLEPKLLDDSYFPSVIYNNIVLQGRFDWLFYYGDNSLSYYLGENIMTEEEMAANLDLLNQLQEVCDEKGIQLEFAVFPNKEQVYSEYMPTYETVPEKKRVDLFAEYVSNNSKVKFLYPIKELKTAKMYYNTYYAYDTHWNRIGAFAGAQSILEGLGSKPVKLSDYGLTQMFDTVADLFIVGNIDRSAYPEDYDYYFDYKPDVEVTFTDSHEIDGYAYGDFLVTRSTSDNTQSFVIIGDSYRTNLIPYLEKEFSECTFVHRDAIEAAKENIKNADILVVSAVERYDYFIFEQIPTLISYLTEE